MRTIWDFTFRSLFGRVGNICNSGRYYLIVSIVRLPRYAGHPRLAWALSGLFWPRVYVATCASIGVNARNVSDGSYRSVHRTLKVPNILVPDLVAVRNSVARRRPKGALRARRRDRLCRRTWWGDRRWRRDAAQLRFEWAL